MILRDDLSVTDILSLNNILLLTDSLPLRDDLSLTDMLSLTDDLPLINYIYKIYRFTCRFSEHINIIYSQIVSNCNDEMNDNYTLI